MPSEFFAPRTNICVINVYPCLILKNVFKLTDHSSMPFGNTLNFVCFWNKHIEEGRTLRSRPEWGQMTPLLLSKEESEEVADYCCEKGQISLKSQYLQVNGPGFGSKLLVRIAATVSLISSSNFSLSLSVGAKLTVSFVST